MKEVVDFLKQNKELFQKPIDKIDWGHVYELALDKFAGHLGKFTEFWLNKGIHPENYLLELPEYFLSHRDITSFEIPDSVTNIGSYAFSGCTNLTSMTIPNSVESISNAAFGFCYSLTSVTIGNSVTSIGKSAFTDCSSLTSIIIPDSITSISDWVFFNCTGLTNVVIPDSIKSIGKWAFRGCTDLKSVIIGKGVTSIDEHAFEDCDQNLVIEYNGTKDEWKEVYNSKAFTNTYFICHCIDGDIVKKKR